MGRNNNLGISDCLDMVLNGEIRVGRRYMPSANAYGIPLHADGPRTSSIHFFFFARIRFWSIQWLDGSINYCRII